MTNKHENKKHEHKSAHGHEPAVHRVRKKDSGMFWKIAVFVLAVILAGVLIFGGENCPETADPVTGAAQVGIDTATAKAEDVIKTNLVPAGTVVTVNSKTEENGLYKMNVDVGGSTADVYISPDGKKLLMGAVDLENPPAPPQAQQPQAAQPADVDMESLMDDDKVRGDADASVTIVEFSDFECPFCGRYYNQAYKQIKENYIDAGKVKYVFRDFPLGFHAKAQKASEAAECAGDQGAYWDMHDRLFENSQKLSVEDLKEHAKALGLDSAEFDDCLDSGKYEDEVKKDLADGAAAGVTGTPAFFVNGKKISGAQPYSAFEAAIEAELA